MSAFTIFVKDLYEVIKDVRLGVSFLNFILNIASIFLLTLVTASEVAWLADVVTATVATVEVRKRATKVQ